MCPLHHQELRHIPCQATLKVVTTPSNHIRLHHYGCHKHPKPHPIRPTPAARKLFETIVRNGPEVKPKSLQIGTGTRPPISDVHGAFGNLDRIAYYRAKVLKQSTHRSTVGNIANFENAMKLSCIVSSSLRMDDGHIVMQTDFMRERSEEKESSLQTDSIEGFVVDEHCPAINLAVTSAYCSVLNRNIPLLVSILMGKSALHYKQHFEALFIGLKMPKNIEDWSDGVNAFPGNTVL